MGVQTIKFGQNAFSMLPIYRSSDWKFLYLPSKKLHSPCVGNRNLLGFIPLVFDAAVEVDDTRIILEGDSCLMMLDDRFLGCFRTLG